jgi:hypothetical protein
VLPFEGVEGSGTGGLIDRLSGNPKKMFGRGVAAGAGIVLVAGGIIAAGTPARVAAIGAAPPAAEFRANVDLATLPDVVIDPSVERIDIVVDEEYAGLLAMTLAENLAIEAEAVRTADGSLLGLSDGGDRLDEMQARLDAAIATGDRWVDEYRFETLTLRLHEAPEGQSSAGLVFESSGTVDRVLYDSMGSEQQRSSDQFVLLFVLRQLAGDRWVIVDVTP